MKNVVLAVAASLLIGSVVVIGPGDRDAAAEQAAALDAPADPTNQAGFTPVTPARLVDTRDRGETSDGQQVAGGRVAPGATFDVQVGGRGGVPTTAKAAIVNVTAVRPDDRGFLTVFPRGSDRPNASNLNYEAGTVVASQVIVRLDADGWASIYTFADTHLLVDVVGWVAESGVGDVIVPARLVDSRADGETVDGRLAGFGRVGAARTLSVDVLGRGGVPSSGVGAVIINLIAVRPAERGYLTVFPDGEQLPDASSLNHFGGDIVSRQVVAKLGESGRFDVFASTDTDLVVDVVAWLPEGADLVAMTPTRLVDTRPTGLTADGVDAARGRLTGGVPIDITIGGRAGVPEHAGAVMLNVTAVRSSADGFITVFPNGEDLPNASSVNFTAGGVAGNQVMVRLGTHDVVRVYSSVDTDLVVDIVAWMPPGVNQPLNNVQTLMDYSESIAPTSGGPGTGGATFPIPEGADVRVDDIVVFETPDGLPYYGRVTGVAGGQATTEEVTIGEVIPSGSFDLTADVETGVIQSSDFAYQSPETVASYGLLQSVGFETKKYSTTCSAGADADVDFSYYVDALNFGANASWSVFGGIDAEVYYQPRIGFDAYADVQIEGECTLTVPLKKRDLKDIKFSIAGIPIIIKHELSLSLEVTISAKTAMTLSAGATVTAKIGLGYDDGFYAIKDFDIQRRIAVNQQSEISLSIGLPIAYRAALYGIAGLEIKFTPKVTGTLRPGQDKWFSLTAQVDYTLTGFIQLKVKIDLLFSSVTLTLDKNWTLASGTVWGPKEIYSRSRSRDAVAMPSNVPPKGAVGAPYRATFSIPYQGSASYKWRASNLPPGLVMTTAANGLSATVSGVPTTVSTYAFGIDVDVEPSSVFANPKYATGSFNVDIQPKFEAVAQTAAYGEQWRPFVGSVVASGGVSPYRWTATGLPSGVGLSASSTTSPIVALTGSPSVVGAGTATITGTDAIGTTITVPIPWTVAAPVAISAPTFPTGGTGVNYSASFTITGGVDPVTHVINGIPYGMTSFRSNRTITVTGTPLIAGSYGVWLSIVSERGGRAATPRYFEVRPALKFASTKVSLPVDPAVMQPSDGWITVLGGKPPYTWTVGTLPAGITFDTSQTGSRARFIGTTTNPIAVPVDITVNDSTGAPTAVGPITIRSALSTTFDTTSLPSAALGAVYDTTVTVSNGRPPYRWSARGLPTGVALVAGAVEGTYRLVGAPTGPAGNYQVELIVGDDTVRAPVVGRFPLVVDTALSLVDGTLPNGVLGTAYSSSATLAVTGGVPPYSWTVTGLPPGVSLDTNTTGASRNFVGTPTTTGTYTVDVSVTDAAGSNAVTGTRTISIVPALSLSIAGLPTKAYTYLGYVGSATASGGNAPITFSATGLPSGMTMSTAGALSGSPTAAGTSTVTVTATDAVGYTQQSSFGLQSIAAIAPDLTNVPTGLATGELYTGSVTATGGVAPYTYTIRNVNGALPGFVNLDPSTGVFSTATPATVDGAYDLEITVADSDGKSATAAYTLTVAATPPIAVSTTGVPTIATVGTAYNGTPTATGGIPPYTWALTTKPSWMSVNSSTGAITGTPDAGNGPVDVTIQATGGIFSNTATVSLDVRPPITIDTGSLPLTGTAGTNYTGTVSWAGGRNSTVTVSGLPSTLTATTVGSTITIAGRPLTGGTYDLVFNGSDADGRTTTANATLVVAAAPAMAIDTSTMPTSVTLSSPTAEYSSTATVTGGVTPYTWTVTGLPAGVTATPSGGTVTFAGRPAASGTFDITLQVDDAGGATVSTTVSVTITVVNLTIDITDLWTIGHQGITESLGTVTAAGGQTPYTFSATNLPAGLTIDSTTGVVSGAATTLGTKAVTVTVTDSSSTPLTASTTWNVDIQTAIPIATPSLPTTFSTTVFVPVVLPAYAGPTPTVTAEAKLPNGTTSTTLFSCQQYGSTTEFGCYGEPTSAGLTLDIFVSAGTSHGAWRGVLDLSNQVKTDVSLGLDYGCAVYADTTMRCWGSNASGQLGNSTVGVGSNAYDPVAVTDASGVEMTGWVNVEANANADSGEAFTCAIRNGTGSTTPTGVYGEVWCWGAGTFGQLGNAASASSATPVRVRQEDRTELTPAGTPTGTVSAMELTQVGVLAVGGRQACVTTYASSSVWPDDLLCWGENTDTVVRNFASVRYEHDFTNAGGTTTVHHAGLPAIGRRHACFTSGNVSCDGPADLVAESNSPANYSPHQVYAAGESGTTAGQVLAADKWDAFGPITFTPSYLYNLVAGHSHTCAIYDDYTTNEVRCWGDNDQRQIGSTSTANHSLGQWPNSLGAAGTWVDPTTNTLNEYQTRFAFSGPAGTFTKIAAGGDVSCGIRTSAPSGIACWGVPYVDAATPNTAALVTTDTTWQQLVVAPNHACALKSTGQLVCWGSNGSGQLGLGSNVLAKGNAYGEHLPYPSNV